MPSSVPLPNALATNEDFEFAALHEANNYRRALLESFGPYLHGAVLEVGAGIGQITSELKQNAKIKHLVAVEPDPKFQKGLYAILPEAQIVPGTVHQVPPTAWDCIISINVLEHIEADAAELLFYHNLLKAKRGALCLFVPARAEIYAPLDKDFGHFRRYSKAELRDKLTEAGFEIVELRYFNFLGYFAWWLSFCVLKRRGFKTSAVRFYDRGIFPWLYWVESKVMAPWIGQSLLAVVRPRTASK